MKFIKLFCLLALITQFEFKPVYSQVFEYLVLRPGIESAAMGGAQTAIVNDYQSFYYNPAGLSRINLFLIGYSKIHYEVFGIAENELPFGGGAIYLRIGVLGFGIYHSTIKNLITSDDLIKQRSYQLSFARRVSDHFRFGLTLKYLKKVSGPGSAYTGDIGMIFENILSQLTFGMANPKPISFTGKFKKSDFRGLAFGVSLLNTGPDKVEYGGGSSDPLPQMLNLGLGYKALASDFLNATLAIDLNKVLTRRRGDKDDNFFKAWFTSWGEDGWDSFHTGIDVNFYHFLSLYFGYEYHFNVLNETKGGTSTGFAIGPDYARLEVYYRVYPILLPDNPDREWRVGVSVSY